MDLSPRKASPSKSSGLKVSWSRTVTTRQAPRAWHCSRETRLDVEERRGGVNDIPRGCRLKTEITDECHDSQFKGLVKKWIEVAVFDLSAASLYLGKDVVWLQTQLHEWITETWQKHEVVRKSSHSLCDVSLWL